MPNKPLDKDNPLRGKITGKWSKYGGAVSGLRKQAIRADWSCQMCGHEIPMELKPFLFELFPGDFIRICNRCQREVIVNKSKNTSITIKRVIKIVRHTRD